MTGLAISPTQNRHVIGLASLAKQVETGGSAVTSSSDFRRPTNLGPGVEALRAKWGWIVALGTIYVLVGLITAVRLSAEGGVERLFVAKG